MAISTRTPNPIYPRLADPFTFVPDDYIKKQGNGDFNAGYEKILDDWIAAWNASAAKNPDIPRTSRKYGMQWIFSIDPKTNAKNKAEYLRNKAGNK